MNTKEDGKIRSYSAVLDAEHGKKGTPSRIRFERDARMSVIGQIIGEARREAKLTQSELAEKVGVTKSYLSRVENGKAEIKVSLLFLLTEALGMSVDLVDTGIVSAVAHPL
jgi:DNA-binding XRE family transcriptional regulator